MTKQKTCPSNFRLLQTAVPIPREPCPLLAKGIQAEEKMTYSMSRLLGACSDHCREVIIRGKGHQENTAAATLEDHMFILRSKLQISKEETKEIIYKIISVAETEVKDKARGIVNQVDTAWRNLFPEV